MCNFLEGVSLKAYLDLMNHILDNGTRKENRTGVDTLSTFNYNYELGFGKNNLYNKPEHNYYHIDDKFPLLTTKKISWKNIVAEMLWFLSGDVKIDILKKHNCKFWDAWADEEGYVPSAYGNFWRAFPSQLTDDQNDELDKMEGEMGGHPGSAYFPSMMYNDQVRWVLEELKRNPMSRRLVVSAWAPNNAQTSKLPPCHLMFIFNVQLDQDGEQRLCLHLTQRSCDSVLGVPYNIASYALLLMLFSQMTNIKPGIFAHTLIDAHIYTANEDGSQVEYDHIPGLKEQLTRELRELPTLLIDSSIKDLEDIEKLIDESVSTEEMLDKIKLNDYNPHPTIKFKVAI